MMTAEQARAELKKDAVDRLPEEERKAIKSRMEILRMNLRSNLKQRIESAIVEGDSKTTYAISLAAPSRWGHIVEEDWTVFEGGAIDIYPHFAIASQLMRAEIEEQVEELRELGYEVKLIASRGTSTVKLEISWEDKETPEQEEQEEPPEEKEVSDTPSDKSKGSWIEKVKSWL